MAEREYRPRWNCRLRLWHRWRTYRADTGELYRRPKTGPVPLEGLYQECLDCGRYREMGHWEPPPGSRPLSADARARMSHALAALRRRWPALVAFVLLGASLGVAHTALTEPTYKSTTSVFLSMNRQAYGQGLRPGLVESYADVTTSPLVLAAVITQVQLQTTPESLARRVHAEAHPNTGIIDISVTDRSPEGAARIASAVRTELQRAVAALFPRGWGRLAAVKVTTLTPATTPTSPAIPQPVRDVGLGLLAGLLLGALTVAAIDTKDHADPPTAIPA